MTSEHVWTRRISALQWQSSCSNGYDGRLGQNPPTQVAVVLAKATIQVYIDLSFAIYRVGVAIKRPSLKKDSIHCIKSNINLRLHYWFLR